MKQGRFREANEQCHAMQRQAPDHAENTFLWSLCCFALQDYTRYVA